MSIELIRLYRHEHFSRLSTGNFSGQTVNKILRYGAPAGSVLEHHFRLERCMGRLQQLMEEKEEAGGALAAGTAVVADMLSHSSGRFDRHWYAPEGGLWLAMAWPDILLPEFSRLIPFAAGLACCRVVMSYGLDGWLKWVNDLLVEDKKIAGILCKTVRSPSGDSYHLIGVGLNVNNRIFPDNLLLPATSIAGELGCDINVSEITGRLLAELSWALGLLHYDEECVLHAQHGCKEELRKSFLLTSWLQYSNTIGQKVEYGFDVYTKPLYRATVKGLDQGGGLILELQDGSLLTEYSGEIRYL